MKGSRFKLPPLKLPADLTQDERDEAMESEVARNLRCFRQGFIAVLGEELGSAVYLVATHEADKPNSKLAPNVSRAVVGKWARRVRENLGLGLEFPAKARAGRKAKAQEVKT